MTKKIDFLLGTVLGIAVALYAVLVVFGYLTSFEMLRAWLNSWQTLLSTIVAVLAASVAILGVRIQVKHSEELKSQEIHRKNLAARALISQPLSEICEIQNKLADYFASVLDTPPINRRSGSYVAPIVGPESIQYLANCIENAEDRAAKDLSILISELQVQKARLRSLFPEDEGTRSTRNGEDFVEHGLDAMLIYARAQRLLLYARNEQEEYYKTAFYEIIRDNCNFMISNLNIRDRTNARLRTIGDSWLGQA